MMLLWQPITSHLPWSHAPPSLSSLHDGRSLEPLAVSTHPPVGRGAGPVAPPPMHSQAPNQSLSSSKAADSAVSTSQGRASIAVAPPPLTSSVAPRPSAPPTLSCTTSLTAPLFSTTTTPPPLVSTAPPSLLSSTAAAPAPPPQSKATPTQRSGPAVGAFSVNSLLSASCTTNQRQTAPPSTQATPIQATHPSMLL